MVSDYWDLFGLNYKGSLGPPLLNTKGPKAVPDCLEYYLFDLSNRLVVKGPSSKFSKFLCKGKDDSYGNGSSKKIVVHEFSIRLVKGFLYEILNNHCEVPLPRCLPPVIVCDNCNTGLAVSRLEPIDIHFA